MFKIVAVVAATSALADAQAVTLTCSTATTTVDATRTFTGARVTDLSVKAEFAPVTVSQNSKHTVAIDNSGPKDMVFSYTPNASKKVDHQVVYTATRHDGEVLGTCTTVVTVKDDTPPELACPAAFSGTMSDYLAQGNPAATDTFDAPEHIKVTREPGTLVFGTNSVTWTAVDRSGNTFSCPVQKVKLACQCAPTKPSKYYVPVSTEDKVDLKNVPGTAFDYVTSKHPCGNYRAKANASASAMPLKLAKLGWGGADDLNVRGILSCCTKHITVVAHSSSGNFSAVWAQQPDGGWPKAPRVGYVRGTQSRTAPETLTTFHMGAIANAKDFTNQMSMDNNVVVPMGVLCEL